MDSLDVATGNFGLAVAMQVCWANSYAPAVPTYLDN